MANPTMVGMVDHAPAVLAVTDVQASVTLDPQREYELQHDGENAAGSASAATIYLATTGNTDADASEGPDKAKLLPGKPALLGPGVSTLRFACASGQAATMTVWPGRRRLGAF